jgi:hypothetical protein
VAFDRRRKVETSGARQHAKDAANEDQLPYLDTDVEGEECKGNVALWKADIE